MQSKYIPAYLLTLVNVLGFGLLLPVLPFVVQDYGGGDVMYGVLLSSYSAFQFLGAPWLGRLSDSTGRKPILLITQVGTLVAWVVFGLAWFLPDIKIGVVALPLLVIAISRMLDGITGGNHSVTQAYVSDISSRQEKSYIFANVGGVAGLGFIIGPGLGGLLASTQIGYLAVAICGFAISVVTLLSIQLSLKESLPLDARKPHEKQSISQSFRLLKRIKRLKPSQVVKRLFLLRALFSAMMAAYIATIALFIIDLFALDERGLGLFMLVVGIFMILNQIVVSKWFIRHFGEATTLRMGLFLCIAGLFLITMTKNFWLYVVYYYVLNLGVSLATPTFNALIAQHGRPQDMGEVMGISSSFVSISNAVLPVCATFIYASLGAVFFNLIAILPAVALLLAFGLNLGGSNSDQSHV